LSAALANAVVSVFIDMNLQTKFEATEAATQFLSTQIESLKKEIEADKKTLQEYAEKSNILSMDDRQNITVQRLAEITSNLSRAQADRVEAESRFHALLRSAGLGEAPRSGLDESAPPARVADLGRFPEVAANQLVQALRAAHDQHEAHYQELARRFKPGWPELDRARQEIDELGRQAEREEWHIVVGLLKRAEAEFGAARGREELLLAQ